MEHEVRRCYAKDPYAHIMMDSLCLRITFESLMPVSAVLIIRLAFDSLALSLAYSGSCEPHYTLGIDCVQALWAVISTDSAT